MILLFRFIHFLIRSILAVVVWLLVALFQLLLPYLLAVLRMLLGLVSMSLSAAVQGPRIFIDRLASKWTQQLLNLGVSREHLDQLYNLCRFLAASMIVLGWVIATLFTVAVLRLFFGYFF